MGTRKRGAANRVAQRLGFKNDYQRRQASGVAKRRALETAGDTAGLKRHDAAVQKNAERRIAAGDAITSTAHSEKVSSGDATVLRSAINRASTADRHLSASVTVLVIPYGTEPEAPFSLFRIADLAKWVKAGFRIIDVELWAQGGYLAELFKADVAAYGVKPAFLRHVREVMLRNKYPDKPVAVLHVDLKADD